MNRLRKLLARVNDDPPLCDFLVAAGVLAVVLALVLALSACASSMDRHWCAQSPERAVACNDAAVAAANATLAQRIRAGAIDAGEAQRALDVLRAMHTANARALQAIAAGRAPGAALTRFDALSSQIERLLEDRR